MRVLVVAQRFGPEIAGGAEYLIRQHALRLARRGHQVTVLTSCATSYVDWANRTPPGVHSDGLLRVHRLGVRAPRDNDRFGPLHHGLESLSRSGERISPIASRTWSRIIGPDLAQLEGWIATHSAEFDVAIFSGYMYSTTLLGLPVASRLLPTVLQCVAHDEEAFRLGPVRTVFDSAAGLNYLTEEERQLVHLRQRPRGVERVIGAGLEAPDSSLAVEEVRSTFGLDEDPYIVCLGRIDPGKGMVELADFFRKYSESSPGNLHLVFVGSAVHPLAPHPSIVLTDFVDNPTKWALLRGASVLVQPSYFESFSLSLAEGWQVGVPALVQRRCKVLSGQANRSGGGLQFGTYSEFAEALSLLLEDPKLCRHMGESGRSYVKRYEWETLAIQFEELLNDSIVSWQNRLHALGGRAQPA